MAKRRPHPPSLIAAAMPGTTAELAAATGLYRDTVWKHIKAMRAAEPQLAHIGGWQRVHEGEFGGRHWVAVFHAGPGKDAPCRLRKKSRKARQEDFWKRAHESGQYDLICAKKRLIYWENKARTQGDPLVHALFGASKKKGEPQPCT